MKLVRTHLFLLSVFLVSGSIAEARPECHIDADCYGGPCVLGNCTFTQHGKKKYRGGPMKIKKRELKTDSSTKTNTSTTTSTEK